MTDKELNEFIDMNVFCREPSGFDHVRDFRRLLDGLGLWADGEIRIRLTKNGRGSFNYECKFVHGGRTHKVYDNDLGRAICGAVAEYFRATIKDGAK